MIPSSIVSSCGKELSYLCHGSSSAIDFANTFGGVEHPEDRQRIVDAIYRLYKSRMLTAFDLGNGRIRASPSTWKQYSKRLLITNPYDGNIDHYAVWTEWDLHATKLSNALVKKFDLDKNDGNWNGFEAILERLFAKHDVSWSDVPLIR